MRMSCGVSVMSGDFKGFGVPGYWGFRISGFLGYQGFRVFSGILAGGLIFGLRDLGRALGLRAHFRAAYLVLKTLACSGVGFRDFGECMWGSLVIMASLHYGFLLCRDYLQSLSNTFVDPYKIPDNATEYSKSMKPT